MKSTAIWVKLDSGRNRNRFDVENIEDPIFHISLYSSCVSQPFPVRIINKKNKV